MQIYKTADSTWQDMVFDGPSLDTLIPDIPKRQDLAFDGPGFGLGAQRLESPVDEIGAVVIIK